jgi:hypothetical protein
VPSTNSGINLPDITGLRPSASEGGDAGEGDKTDAGSAFGEGNNESTALIEIARGSPPPAPVAARAAANARPASGPGMRPGAPVAPPPPTGRAPFSLDQANDDGDDEATDAGGSSGSESAPISAAAAAETQARLAAEDDVDTFAASNDDELHAAAASDATAPSAAADDGDELAGSGASADADADTDADADSDPPPRSAFGPDAAPTQILRAPSPTDQDTQASQPEAEPDADGELTGTAGRADAAELDAPAEPETEPESGDDEPPILVGPAPAPSPAPTAPAKSEPTPIDPTLAAFHRAKFLADLDFDQRGKLWAIGTTLDFEAGTTILTYNDEPKGVYIIVQGAVSCYRHVGGKDVYVDQMGESESFGELWLLADQPTAVKFVAAKPTRLRLIDRSAFNDLMDKDGTIARKVYKRFTLRLLKRLLKPQNPQRNQAAS